MTEQPEVEPLCDRMLKDPASNEAARRVIVAAFNNNHKEIEAACADLDKEQMLRTVAFMGAWLSGVIESVIEPRMIQAALHDLRTFVIEQRAKMS